MRIFITLTLAGAGLSLAVPVAAQQTHAGTPTGTVHSSMKGTDTRTADPSAQKKRFAAHKKKVKRADAAATKADGAARRTTRPRS